MRFPSPSSLTSLLVAYKLVSFCWACTLRGGPELELFGGKTRCVWLPSHWRLQETSRRPPSQQWGPPGLSSLSPKSSCQNNKRHIRRSQDDSGAGPLWFDEQLLPC